MKQANTSDSGGRRVLTDVKRIGFYPEIQQHESERSPEGIIFPSCMRSVMQHLGHPEYDYIHFVGVTGAGFYLNWKDGWHADNSAIYYMVPHSEHIKLFEYAFESTGYALDLLLLKGEQALSEEEARSRIVSCIDAGSPIISHGVVGPPETCIIAGYGEGGEVLIGWSFFQHFEPFNRGLEFESNGMFRKRNWFPETYDLFCFGERRDPPDPRTVARTSLEWAVKVVRTKETWNGRTNNGLAAYDAWADHLLRDEEITADGRIPEGSNEVPFNVHNEAAGMVAEGRYYASEYLIRLAQADIKMRTLLLKAAASYSREHDLMWEIWDCCGGNGRSPQHMERFAEPATRRKIVSLIQQAKEEDQRAIEYIEEALSMIA